MTKFTAKITRQALWATTATPVGAVHGSIGQRWPTTMSKHLQRLRDRVDAEVEAFLQHELMKETKDYLDRGRRFAELSSAEVVERCITAVKLFVERHVGSHVTDMDDAYAELRLRGLNLPEGAIKAEIEMMRAEIERGGPEAPPGLREKLEAYRAECNKPKH